MAPALVLVVLFFVAPVVITLGMSLTDMATTTGLSNWHWNGLDNYERIVRGRFTLLILGNTIFYVVVTLTSTCWSDSASRCSAPTSSRASVV